MDVRPRRIEVEIGELVLHGLPAVQRHAIGDAVARELERLLADGGAIRPDAIDHADAGSIRIASGSGERTGTRIARAVHGALGRTGGAP